MRVSLVATDRPLLIALALALSVFAVIYTFEAGRQLAQYVYWEQRTSTFLEQLSAEGVPVPKDILEHIKKEHNL